MHELQKVNTVCYNADIAYIMGDKVTHYQLSLVEPCRQNIQKLNPPRENSHDEKLVTHF